MNTSAWLEFELRVGIGANPVLRIRILPGPDRCVASVLCGQLDSDGIGTTPREALVAALAPLGARATTAVMAAPAMFGASAALLRGEAAAG